MTFIKQHKALSGIFLLCLFLMLKNSEIPYVFYFHPVVVLLDKPKGPFWGPVFQMLDVFSSAYVTSLLFYIIVDYLPAQRQREKAITIIQPKLVSLYLYIQELLEMITYSACQQNLSTEGDELDNLYISNDQVVCKQISFINGTEIGRGYYPYCLLNDLDKYRNLILKSCDMISGTPSFSLCNDEIVHIISEIQLLELLRTTIPNKHDILIECGMRNIVYVGFGEGYRNLKVICSELDKFVEKQHSYKMIDISKEEVDRIRTEQIENIKKHPEIIQLIRATEENET